ncbi:hypothetical protein HLB23_12455 [Nocardia uniformis]|uniref:Uncharacterized protein n=1 Tax=Nocardia uniformis TaxID=53432 RepID=A0A849C2X4_9NOCA|nr:hypothetical protein [Nocardia uniformis]NNH70665.1 hypothetical protein [Nocardia uniformis]
MDLSAIERQVSDDRRAAADRSADAELRLADSLCEFATALIATKNDESVRDRSPGALEPAQEAVHIRLRWLSAGRVDAQFAGKVQDALRLFEHAARTIGHRQLATHTIRDACDAYRFVAQKYPNAAAACADSLSKCGVWLMRLDPDAAVAASADAVRIRAALFANDPETAARYLASLDMLLRTFMVGRQRKPALAQYRELYTSVTSAAMTARLREIRVEDIGFTSKTLTALTKLDALTLDRAGYLTQQQILYQTSGDLSTIEEINWKLALVGLKPLAAGALPDQPSRPMEIATSFGALSVRCSDSDALDQVRAAVIASYTADGAQIVDATAFLGVDQKHWSIPQPQPNPEETLGDDVVLLERTSEHWISVKSLKWEVAPVGKHPLALRLSKNWPVVTVATTENLAYEMCWYEDGAATQYAALGRPAGPSALDTPLAPLNFGALAEYGADYASETQVRAAFGNTPMFAKLTRLPASGIRQAAETGPLTDFGDHIVYFRRHR